MKPTLKTRRGARRRRGILLLMILSLLVLFVLVGVTFIIVADQYADGAKIFGKLEQTGDSPERQLDEAMHQLLRGTVNPASALLGHDLLGDTYGSDLGLRGLQGVLANVYAVDPVSGVAYGDLIRLRIPVAARNDEYSGCLITMLDGPAAGVTTPIARSLGADLYALSFRGSTGAVVVPATGNRFLINGRPFNGTGAGYFGPSQANPSAATLQMNRPVDVSTNYLVKDAPRFGSYARSMATVNPAMMSLEDVAYGGLDESWDAPDVQNMFMAMMLGQATQSADDILPSFHRPELIHYLQEEHHLESALGGNPLSAPFQAAATILRGSSLRPSWIDNPRFSGSNPAFDLSLWDPTTAHVRLLAHLMSGQYDSDLDGTPDQIAWDVDNDGDGVPDSIWIDLGLPPQQTPDGRVYKPLFAILCQDLDGRVNVNAAGSLAQADAAFGTFVTSTRTPASGERSVAGLGSGPADISLRSIMPNQTVRQVCDVAALSGDPHGGATPRLTA